MDPDAQIGGHIPAGAKAPPARQLEFGPDMAAALIALAALGLIVVIGVSMKGARA